MAKDVASKKSMRAGDEKQVVALIKNAGKQLLSLLIVCM